MGNQLAEERRHRAARYETSSIVRPLAVAAGFNRVVAGTLPAVIAGTRKLRALSFGDIQPRRSRGRTGIKILPHSATSVEHVS